MPHESSILKKLPVLLVRLLVVAVPARAQDSAEIPLFNAPSGTVVLGVGLRFGQSPYLAPDD